MKQIRYGIVGLGYIAQAAVLPAFQHAENSVCAAVFSDDRSKLRFVGRKYGIEGLYSYAEYDEVLARGEVDAVYIALPNHLHHDYAIRAANAGVHVLCEKPMAVNASDCEAMIRAARERGVKLMVAYRLHFDEANLAAIEVGRSGDLGELRIFESVFTMPVRENNIRLNPRRLGGGPLYDVGIYCINASRYIFQSEPEEVIAASVAGMRRKFKNVDEAISVVLRFPRERLAAFTCSFGAAPQDFYRVIGEKGDLLVEEAYGYIGEISHKLTIGEKTKERVFPPHDQFGPELVYFSNCIAFDREPEPSGIEGLADMRIIDCIFEAADSGRAVAVPRLEKIARPRFAQRILRPPVKEPELKGVQEPSLKSA